MLNIVINGRNLQVSPDLTILQAAQQAGIDIPTFCYDPDLEKVGSCRMCVVEVEKARTLMPSCTTPVAEGMVIHTESPAVIKARKIVLELLLSDHPMDCLTCEKSGNCKLQDYCYRYGIKQSRFQGEAHNYQVHDPNPFLERDYNKCILCTKCIRVCEDVYGVGAIGAINRGFHTKVGVAYDRNLEDSPCVFCGSCVMICPTGALTSKVSAGTRSWEIERKVLTTCPYCGTGCTLELNVKGDRIVGVTSNRSMQKSPVNQGYLCVKGRFGWEFVNHPDRLTTPLIKENGQFRQATWDEALDMVAGRLNEIKEQYGGESIGVFSSARITNEENYLVQKFARAVVGTNTIDHCARL